MTQVHPTSPEQDRFFELLPGPSQNRVRELNAAAFGVAGLYVEEVKYVRPAKVPDFYTVVSQSEQATETEPVTDGRQEAGEKSSMLKGAYDMIDEALGDK